MSIDTPPWEKGERKEHIMTWWKAAGIRAAKTIAQTALATIGTETVLGDINWAVVVSASLLAGILSLLTSVAGLPEVKEESMQPGKASRGGKSRRSRRKRGGEKSAGKSVEKDLRPAEGEKKESRPEKGKKATVKPVKVTPKAESAAPARDRGESKGEKRSARPNRRRRSRGKPKAPAAE